ncbi:MAG: DUF4271 domain-containing protein [Bacteroidota bacterium]
MGPSILSDTVFKIPGIVSSADVTENGMVLLQRSEIHHPTWFFIYLFALLGYYAWIRVYYGDIFTQTVRATSNFQVASRMYLDSSTLKNQLDRVLYVQYFLAIAFLLYFVELRMELMPYELNGILLYFFNLALLGGIFLGRIVLLNLVGFLFNQEKVFREYLYNTFIFNKLMGLVVLSLLLFTVYTKGVVQDVFFWLTLSIVGLIFLMRLGRGIIFSFRKDVLIFYMFLYLCALEIAPLVLLYRWLVGVL